MQERDSSSLGNPFRGGKGKGGGVVKNSCRLLGALLSKWVLTFQTFLTK